MSARNQRLRASAGMLRDIAHWRAFAGIECLGLTPASKRDVAAWKVLESRCEHYRNHVANPHIAPATPRKPLQTILVPLYVWRKVSRQADAFARARRKRTEQIKRRNAL